MRFPFAITHAWREARSSWRRIGLYMGSITLGVAALVAINSLRSSVIASVELESRTLLGADLRLGAGRAFSPRIQAVIDSAIAKGVPTTYVTRTASMAYVQRTGATRLVQVRGVGRDYPYYGTIKTQPAGLWNAFRSQRAVLVDPAVLVQLGAAVGDSLNVGISRFIIAGTVDMPTDVSFQGALGPRVFMSDSLLPATGVLAFGSLARYEVYMKIPSDVTLNAFTSSHEAVFRTEQTRWDTADKQARQLTRALDNLTRFLSLVGLTALLLGGIGVASAVNVFVKEKLPSIAVLRCLGARQSSVFTAYLLQAGLLGVAGAAVGVLIGLVLQAFIPRMVHSFLPVEIGFTIDWIAIGAGLLIGAWVATVFALIPLLTVRDVSPLQALRREYDAITPRRDVWRALAYVSLFASVVLISLWQAPAWRIALAFSAGIGATVILLWLTALFLVRATRRFFPRGAAYVYRQGVSNLFRPHNQTVAVTLSLGFGVFLIGTLYLVQRNLLDRIAIDEGTNRPNLLMFDIQSDQRKGVEDILRTHHATGVQITPMVTARIAAINGVPVANIPADSDGAPNGADNVRDRRRARPEAWALRREYRNTYRAELAPTEKLLAGKWWNNPRNGGPPRISVDTGLSENLKVKIGDRITWDVQGRQVETVIANLRSVNWAQFSPNFFVVFEPGVLEQAPQTMIALARKEGDTERSELQRDLVRAYPNVSSIDLGVVQKTLDGIVDKVTMVIRFLALFSILGGIIVLIGALTTSRFQRTRESALLKTLGAGRAQVGRILFTEYLALGVLAGLTGMLLSGVAGWALIRFFFKFPFRIPVPQLLALWVGVAVLTVAIGLLNSRDVLNRPPLVVLREAE